MNAKRPTDVNRVSIRAYSEHKDFRERNENFRSTRLRDHAVTASNAKMEVHFDGIQDLICKEIRMHEVVVGAVAWLTNKKILASLASAQLVSIVVQKEDFLRIDSKAESSISFKKRIHDSYKALRPIMFDSFSGTYPGTQFGMPDYNDEFQDTFDARGLPIHGDDAIRCLGYSRIQGRIVPFMHHKFLVLGRRAESLIMYPEKVITGSYNFTENSKRSRENILVIENNSICHAYISEWAQLWLHSEPLNWTSTEPHDPEIYVGT